MNHLIEQLGGALTEGKYSAKDAAEWADVVAKKLATLIKGAKYGVEGAPRLTGVLTYPKGYISLVSGVGGKDHDFVWAKVMYYGRGAYKKGHGFAMHPRQVTTIEGTPGDSIPPAAKAAQAIKKSHFAKP